jgi:hypothetical protein
VFFVKFRQGHLESGRLGLLFQEGRCLCMLTTGKSKVKQRDNLDQMSIDKSLGIRNRMGGIAKK